MLLIVKFLFKAWRQWSVSPNQNFCSLFITFREIIERGLEDWIEAIFAQSPSEKKETVVFSCNFFKNMIGRDGILLCKWNVTYFYLSQPWNCGNKACPFSMSIHLSHSCKITHIQMSLLHSLCFTGHCYHVPKTPIPLSLSNFSVTTKWHS